MMTNRRNFMDKKLLFFDIDGTLINCHTQLNKMSDKTKYSLETLKKAGHQVFIASGRSLCFMPLEIQKYPFDGYISCNGASIHLHGKKIHQDLLSFVQLKRLDNFAKKHHIIYFLEDDEFIYTNQQNHPQCLNFIEKWQMPLTRIRGIQLLETLKVQMAMIVCPDEETLSIAKQYFADDFDVQVHPGQLSSDLSLKTSSKGKGIQKLGQHLHIDIKNTIAFGDGPNDVEMFKTVHLPLAMGNAVDELKLLAKDVLLSVDDDGIYHSLIKQGLINKM